jgi:hypothetical protein
MDSRLGDSLDQESLEWKIVSGEGRSWGEDGIDGSDVIELVRCL